MRVDFVLVIVSLLCALHRTKENVKINGEKQLRKREKSKRIQNQFEETNARDISFRFTRTNATLDETLRKQS